MTTEARRFVAAVRELWDIRAQKGTHSPSTMKALAELREYVKEEWLSMKMETRREVEKALS
jgi:hypothetical protein